MSAAGGEPPVAAGAAVDVHAHVADRLRAAAALHERAMEAANARGMVTIALTGRAGGAAVATARHPVNVPEPRTALAQEVHATVRPIWCEPIDRT